MTFEQNLNARKTKHEIRFTFCEVELHGMCWPTNVGFLYIDEIKEVDVRCNDTSRKGKQPSTSFSRVNLSEGCRLEIILNKSFTL